MRAPATIRTPAHRRHAGGLAALLAALALAVAAAWLPGTARAADTPTPTAPAAGAAATAAPAATTAPAAAPAAGPTDTGILTSPEQRDRYHRLAEELRCLVCQNQTLADSNAELAADLRHQVEAMIQAGRSNDEIKAYLVQRYGDFVLYRPPVQRNTWLLWLGPFALLLVGAFVWWRVQRRGRPATAPAPDLDRARRLLDE
ncbi:MAG: cytochrome c-type biogenesis protein CcmH [Burkholderiaceae bacterium]|nr:cytochrome c-type biogenesis protein CcmH [Burkholderiaceae bacterium]